MTYIRSATINNDAYHLDDRGRIVFDSQKYSPQVMATEHDEQSFDAYVATRQKHHQELEKLGRHELPSREKKYCTWGVIDGATQYDEGIVSVFTPSHGGFILTQERNIAVHPAWANKNCQYEEDSAWAVVAHTFPNAFTTMEKEYADKTLRSTYPDEYETVTGKKVDISESHELKRRKAEADNQGKLVTISAINDGDAVRVTATLNGDRSGEARTFMVPKDEYKMPIGGFVIDEKRYPEVKKAA